MRHEEGARASVVQKNGPKYMAIVTTAHAYSASALDETGNDGAQRAVVRLWCLTAFTNEPIVVTVRGIKPWCFVELPRYHHPGGNRQIKQAWTDAAALELVVAMRAALGPSPDEPANIVSGELVHKRKLYYYQPKRLGFPMLKLRFDSLGDMRAVANKIESSAWLPTAQQQLAKKAGSFIRERGRFYGRQFGRLVLRCWEHDISLVRKLATTIDLKYTQWFDVIGGERRVTRVEPGDEHSDYTVAEYAVSLGSSTRGWSTTLAPLSDAEVLARGIPASAPTLLAFDIETYTDNHRALPDSNNEAHCVTLITCVFQRARAPSTQRRFVIAATRASISRDAQEVADSEFIIVADEATMLEEFATLIARLDPDVLTGYNINGYDVAYLDTRYRREVDVSGRWPQGMSRAREGDVIVENRTWFSKGTGTVESNVFATEGRLTIDLMPLIKRDHKLTKYTLNAVSQHFLKSQKHDVTAKEMFLAYEAAVQTHRAVEAGVLEPDAGARVAAIAGMTRVAAYGVQDSVLVVDLFEKLNVWIGLVELSSVTGVTIAETYSRGQQCRVVSLLYDLASRRDVVLDKRRLPAPRPKEDADKIDDESIIRFKGGYVGNPVVGLHDNVLCMDFASLYPSIIVAFNISHDTLQVETSPLEDLAFSGKVRRHDAATAERAPAFGALVATCDAPRLDDSRYSSAKLPDDDETRHLIAFEDSGEAGEDPHAADSHVPAGLAPERDEPATAVPAAGSDDSDGSDGDDSAADAPPLAESSLPTKRRYAFKFVTPKVRVGLLPTLVTGLVEERSRIRAKMDVLRTELKALEATKHADDDSAAEQIAMLRLQINVLDQRQLAVKVTSNSVYGVIGAQISGSHSLVEGAMSVTAYGRQLIHRVYEYVQSQYSGRIIGGDTDSCFFQLPEQIRAIGDCNFWGERLARELTSLFPRPLKVEFEKAMRMLALKKKMYAALVVNADGTGYKDEILTRGIVLARRDKCRFLTDTYRALIEHALHRGSAVEGLRIVQRAVCDALATEASVGALERFEIVNSVGASYKQTNFRIAVFVAECTKAGYPTRPGDRLGFVIVEQPSSVPAPDSGIKPGNLGLKMKLVEAWRHEFEAGEASPVDVMYYVENLCSNPLDQLFTVAYSAEIKRCVTLDFQPRSNVTYTILAPVRMFCKMVRFLNMRRAREKPPRAPMSRAEMALAFETIFAQFEAAMAAAENS